MPQKRAVTLRRSPDPSSGEPRRATAPRGTAHRRRAAPVAILRGSHASAREHLRMTLRFVAIEEDSALQRPRPQTRAVTLVWGQRCQELIGGTVACFLLLRAIGGLGPPAGADRPPRVRRRRPEAPGSVSIHATSGVDVILDWAVCEVCGNTASPCIRSGAKGPRYPNLSCTGEGKAQKRRDPSERAGWLDPWVTTVTRLSWFTSAAWGARPITRSGAARRRSGSRRSRDSATAPP